MTPRSAEPAEPVLEDGPGPDADDDHDRHDGYDQHDQYGDDGEQGGQGGQGDHDQPAPRAAGRAPALAERSRRILAFERRWWRRPGAKEQAIRDELGMAVTRYYQLLNRLLDDPAALAHDPVLVGRLRRLRERRAGPRRGVPGR